MTTKLYQRDIKPCGICGKGLMHTNCLTAYRVTIDHLLFNPRAIQRQHGLEQMLGGNAAIAHAMGPQEPMAESLSTESLLVCQECAIRHATPLAVVMEAAAEHDDTEEKPE